MPTKRMFDLMVLVALFSRPAFGLLKMWAASHAQNDGLDGTAAQTVMVMA